MDPRKRLCRTEFSCSLQKGGRQISFLITDLEGGGFELQLMRSDAATLSVRLFDVREQRSLSSCFFQASATGLCAACATSESCNNGTSSGTLPVILKATVG